MPFDDLIDDVASDKPPKTMGFLAKVIIFIVLIVLMATLAHFYPTPNSGG